MTIVVTCWGCRNTHAALGTGLVLGERVTCACNCHDTTPIILTQWNGEYEVPFTVSMALPMFDRMAKEVLG
jgi:hypothetical protein